MGKFQAAAEAVFAQGGDVAADNLVAADKQVCLDPLGSIGMVQHRIGIPGNGLAAAPPAFDTSIGVSTSMKPCPSR